MVAIIDVKDLDEEKKTELIGRNLEGLKEALEKISGYEAKRAKE
jgi:hypothetical protein